MSDTDICGHDTAAYALGALEPAEADAFRAHLRHCAVCQEEFDSFGHLVDLLPLSAPQYRVPSRLRQRVMARVRSDQVAARPVRRAAARRPRLALAGAGLAAMGAAGLFGATVSGGPGAPATHVYRAAVGAARVRVTDGRAELIVQRLPQLPDGRIYEVWLEHGGAPQPTKALFGVTRTGQADVVVPGYSRTVSAVLVTSEPAGGSPRPTTDPVVVANL